MTVSSSKKGSLASWGYSFGNASLQGNAILLAGILSLSVDKGELIGRLNMVNSQVENKL
jgi:hypothetical protein